MSKDRTPLLSWVLSHAEALEPTRPYLILSDPEGGVSGLLCRDGSLCLSYDGASHIHHVNDLVDLEKTPTDVFKRVLVSLLTDPEPWNPSGDHESDMEVLKMAAPLHLESVCEELFADEKISFETCLDIIQKRPANKTIRALPPSKSAQETIILDCPVMTLSLVKNKKSYTWENKEMVPSGTPVVGYVESGRVWVSTSMGFQSYPESHASIQKKTKQKLKQK